MGYIANFIVYTLAMVGVIVVALLVFKNATCAGNGRKSKYLKIIDSISLGQRKNLYIISTGKEQFLIAGDVNNTSLISKINLDNISVDNANKQVYENNSIQDLLANTQTGTKSFQDTLNSLNRKNYMDKSNIGIQSSLITPKTSSSKSVIQNIAEILK